MENNQKNTSDKELAKILLKILKSFCSEEIDNILKNFKALCDKEKAKLKPDQPDFESKKIILENIKREIEETEEWVNKEKLALRSDMQNKN